MPVTWVLPWYDEAGVRHDIGLEDGTLGYPHVIVHDGGTDIEIPNVPPEAPPVGKFPWTDELGVEHLLDFAPLNVTGGALLVFPARVHQFIDGSRRFSVGQLGDSLLVRVAFKQRTAAGWVPLPIANAQLREITFNRPDATAFVKPAAQVGDGSSGEAEYQFQPGEADYAGEWSCQGRVVLQNGAEWKTEVQTFTLKHNLATS